VFNWLFEGRLSVTLLLTAVALVLLAVWWRERKRALLIAVGVVVALIVIYLLLGTFLPTEAKIDRVQIHQRIEEMANGVVRHDRDAIVRNLSDQFRSPEGKDKRAVVESIPPGIQLTVSDIEIPEAPVRCVGTTKVNFHVQLLEPINRPVYVESVFDWNAENGWRLRELHVFPIPVGDEFKKF
jgi:hypothetical protein